jgi:hypothetical protein
MKKISTYLTLIVLTFLTASRAYSQASCPQIVLSSFQIITDPSNSCLKKISVDFINPTGGAKSIGVKVKCGTVIVLTECHDASNQKDVRRNFVTGQFICCALNDLKVEVAAYTGNSTCLGTPCIQQFSIAGSSLPVYFKSFNAARKGSSVNLSWVTGFEQNNRGFDIERQNGTGSWQELGFIASSAAGGNSTTEISYSYVDANSASGITNYRIKQTDLDGKTKYSEVRSVQGDNDNARTLTLYPNPATNGQVTIVFKEATAIYDVSLMDVTGRILRQWKETKGNSLNITNLVPGFYNLRVVSRETGKQVVEKFVVSH